jgi:hypothetical protein
MDEKHGDPAAPELPFSTLDGELGGIVSTDRLELARRHCPGDNATGRKGNAALESEKRSSGKKVCSPGVLGTEDLG